MTSVLLFLIERWRARQTSEENLKVGLNADTEVGSGLLELHRISLCFRILMSLQNNGITVFLQPGWLKVRIENITSSYKPRLALEKHSLRLKPEIKPESPLWGWFVEFSVSICLSKMSKMLIFTFLLASCCYLPSWNADFKAQLQPCCTVCAAMSFWSL